MKPIILISGNFRGNEGQCTLAEGYYNSVVKAGGVPIVIPPHTETEEDLKAILDSVDGIMLSGGGDIDPDLLGEEREPEVGGVDRVRDEMEMKLVRLAYDRQLPMFGICKGAQVINAALGGKLIQHIGIPSHSQETPKSETSHSVGIDRESVLFGIFGKDRVEVNSFHHQAIKSPAPCLKVTAMSDDGIIEAVESDEHKSIIGVQWHPEALESMMPLFTWFVEECREFKKAKEVHCKVLSLDSHCDTPMVFADMERDGRNDSLWNISIRNPHTLVDFEKMKEGHLDGSIMVAYLKQEGRDDKSLAAATKKADCILSHIETMAKDHIAYCPEDLWKLKHEGIPAIMMGIENGYAIGKDISNVERFRKRGVVYMTLCHNGDNDICDSAKGNNEHGGVSPFGAEVIREMNRVGMMVDLSHAGEKSFYDALEISRMPIVCTHSSARTLCDHPRNLTDEQMKALARKDGVAQVTFYHGFLRKDDEASIIDAVEHLNHMVKVMGIEHVGIGTDFDGDGGVKGVASASELINFTRRLIRQRYSEEDIRLLWGGNFLRVMERVNNEK